MKLLYPMVVAALALGSLSARAPAQCTAPVSIAVTTTGSFTQSCVLDPLTSRWNVTVTINGPVSANSTVTIRGGSTLMLGKVTIQNNSAIDCRVNILGSGFDQRIGGVGFIDRGTSGANRVLLLQLNTNGDVGYDKPANAAINVDMIFGLSIGGSVLGDLVSQGTSRTFGNVYIQGDLAGGINLGPTSSIDNLWIGGALGRPNDPPAFVRVSGNISNLTAASINADITTLWNGAAGTVHALDATAGPFKGSLTCHRLARLSAAAGEPHFAIAGDLDASLTLTRDIRVPVTVGGNFTSARTVAGNPIPNVITTGTGVFDDPAADPAASIIVSGNFNGAMSLGTPLSAGLASLNRPVTINGSMNGSISAAQDLDASITIGGALTGSISADGSLRSGRSLSLTGPFSPTALVSLGHSLLGTIACPPGGLQGQVIINARNLGGQWLGAITVGGASPFVAAPYYANASAPLGGGAVGLVPFHADLFDCTPPHNSPTGFVADTAFANAAAKPVTMRLYGPVQCPQGLTPVQAVAVEQFVNGSWMDRSPYLKADFAPPGAPASRLITLGRAPAAPGNPPIGQYRLRPLALQCSAAAGAPGIVWTDPYLFRIDADCNGNGQPDGAEIAANAALDQNHDGVIDTCQGLGQACPCDQDHSGSISIQDIFTFLGDFFSGAPSADFDHSGTVSIQDVFSFLACFFQPPPGC